MTGSARTRPEFEGLRPDPVVRVSLFTHDRARFAVISLPRPVSSARLSPAETAVGLLAAAGATNAEIARIRKRSARTISNQITTILRKLGAKSRRGIAGLLTTPPDVYGRSGSMPWRRRSARTDASR